MASYRRNAELNQQSNVLSRLHNCLPSWLSSRLEAVPVSHMYSFLPLHPTDVDIDELTHKSFAITVSLIRARLHNLSNGDIGFYLARFSIRLKKVNTCCHACSSASFGAVDKNKTLS